MIGREQLERLWMSLLALGGRRLSRACACRRDRVRDGRLERLLPEPAGSRDALRRSQCPGRQPHRRDAPGSRHRLRCEFPGQRRARASRASRAGSHAAGREGPAEQHQRRLRAVRQAGLHRPHVVHAGGHAGPRARGRDCAHHPGHARREGRPRAHRAARQRILPPQPATAVGLRHHPHRIPRRLLGRRPPSGISLPPPYRA